MNKNFPKDKIKIVISDFDGVFTDGKLTIYSDGTTSKNVDYKDIMAIANILKQDIKFAIICVFGLLIGIIESIKSDDWVCLFTSILMGVITGAILALMLGWAVQIPTEYTNQCKVTVLDEVSMNEFTEKYDIISQEGRIYTVREKVQ